MSDPRHPSLIAALLSSRTLTDDDEDAPVEAAAPEEEERGDSMRLGFGARGSYFAGIGQRAFHAAVEECDGAARSRGEQSHTTLHCNCMPRLQPLAKGQ